MIHYLIKTERLIRFSTVVLVLAGISQESTGKPVSESTLRSVVETWVRNGSADARSDATVALVEPYVSKGDTVAYIAHLNDSGFCICGADDRILPVYLYSPGGRYEDAPDAALPILDEVEDRTGVTVSAAASSDSLSSHIRAVSVQRQSYWAELAKGSIPSATLDGSPWPNPAYMELPLTTKWHQGTPFNQYCPMGDGGRSWVGCTITAGAQLARYWNWPPSGHSTFGYNWDGDNSCNSPGTGGGYLSANFADAYDWANMPDQVWASSDQAYKNAVAELSYEIGVGSQTDYGYCGSGASVSNMIETFEDHLRYDHDAYVENRHAATHGAIVTDIQYLRPGILAGDDGEVGHAWIVYGYNYSGSFPLQFLMNMGWGSSWSRVWYTLDDCMYTNHQRHARHMAPTSVKFARVGGTGDGSPSSPYGSIGEAISEAPSSATIVFLAGESFDCGSGPLVVSKPLTLTGHQVVLQ